MMSSLLRVFKTTSALLAVALTFHSSLVLGVNVQWFGPGIDWDDAANWNLGAGPVPGTGDTVFINGAPLIPATVSTDVDLINGPVDGVFVGQGADDGLVNIVAGGNITSSNFFALGQDSGRSGTLNMSGGSLNSVNMQVGNNGDGLAGTGTANISGGTVTLSEILFVGAGLDAVNSSVTQSGVTADFDGSGTVDGLDLDQWEGDFGANGESDADGDGDSDGGDFLRWQRQLGLSGGSGGDVIADNVHVGENSAGTYTLSAGTLTANNVSTPEFSGLSVGFNSPGTFNQTGGTVNNQEGHLAVGLFAPAVGSAYNLSGSGVVNVNNNGLLIIGNEGNASFNQSGGTVNLTSTALVGRLGVGTLDISGGNFNGTVIEIAGTDAGSDGSSVTQSGGTVAVHDITIGGVGTGSYTLSGGVLDMASTGAGSLVQVGNTAAGTLNISGGTLNAEGINPGAFAQGTMNISGTADVNLAGNMLIGATSGAAGSTVVQSGGSLDLGTMFVGVGGSGSYSLSDGSATMGSMNVGQGSSAAVTQSGGSVSSLNVLVGVSSTGTYELSAGSLTTNATGVLSVGRGNDVGAGNGTLTQTGGSIITERVDIGGDILVATDTGTGVFNMSAGTLDATGGVVVDTIAPHPGSSGELNLSGTASYTSEAIAVGDNLLTFTGSLGSETPGGTGRLSITGPDVDLALGGIWIGNTGTLEVIAGTSISTIVTNGGIPTTGGGTFLLGVLDLDLSSLASNADLTLIDNTNAAAQVLGTFNGLPEGFTFNDSSGTKTVTITYQGGADSNDVMLTNIVNAISGVTSVPEPSSLMMCLAVGLLAGVRRRR